jgi:hypothetical protein
MELLRPNAQRAKTAVIFLYIVMALDLVNLISEYLQYRLLQIAANGGEISEQEAYANDGREAILGMIYAMVFITSGIFFICWFRRAYYNLHLKIEYLKYGEGWAAGAWFTPILCLFRPYEIMKELYRETDRILTEKSPGYASKNNGTLMGLWWALWITSSLAGNFLFRSSINTQTVDGLIVNTVVDMALSLIGVPLGFLAIKLVKDYSNMETALAELKEEPNESAAFFGTEQPV